ncbi:aldose 1-epimerase family protein [Oribacterium sp. HCP3S3_B9]|uniref:aldose 1-epimerase family protein n=1 Tax=Oribacterium sp. HCP3S3_B9 TaxID=3438946 RepID=UPI003F8A1B9F
MIYTLRNSEMEVQVSSKGGELVSMKDADKTEYIWIGDATYWKRHAPQLFPCIGRLTNNQYRMDGALHEMGQHGFLRDYELTKVESEEQAGAETVRDAAGQAGAEAETVTSLHLQLQSDTSTRQLYDRDWTVDIFYSLCGKTLIVKFQVRNRDVRTMRFGYGIHPGFNVPLNPALRFEDYRLDFHEVSTPKQMELTERYTISGGMHDYALAEGRYLPLQHSLFDHDAIILKDMPHTVTLGSQKDEKKVTVTFPDMPYLGIWHAPETDAPFVCIEPWSSLPSTDSVIDEFETKPDFITVEPEETYTNSWSISIEGGCMR